MAFRAVNPNSESQNISVPINQRARIFSSLVKQYIVLDQTSDFRRFVLVEKVNNHSSYVKDRQRFIVFIGPQTCSCTSDGTTVQQFFPCFHLIFVMVKVLKMNQNDPRIFAKNLSDKELQEIISSNLNSSKISASPLGANPYSKESLEISKSQMSSLGVPSSSTSSNSSPFDQTPVCRQGMSKMTTSFASYEQQDIYNLSEIRQRRPSTAPGRQQQSKPFSFDTKLGNSEHTDNSNANDQAPTLTSNSGLLKVTNLRPEESKMRPFLMPTINCQLCHEEFDPCTTNPEDILALDDCVYHKTCLDIVEAEISKKPDEQVDFNDGSEDLLKVASEDFVSWSSIFGKKIALSLCSIEQSYRQNALQEACDLTLQNLTGNGSHKYIASLLKIVHRLLDDISDGIVAKSIACCKKLLNSIVCEDNNSHLNLEVDVNPILRRLLRIAGGNLLTLAPVQAYEEELNLIRRDTADKPSKFRSSVAFNALVEFTRGQEGEMSLGSRLKVESVPLTGRLTMAKFILKSHKFHQTHLIGRLKLLQRIVVTELGLSEDGDSGASQPLVNIETLNRGLVFASRHVYKPKSSERYEHSPKYDYSFTQFSNISVFWARKLFLEIIKLLLYRRKSIINGNIYEKLEQGKSKVFTHSEILNFIYTRLNTLDPTLREEYVRTIEELMSDPPKPPPRIDSHSVRDFKQKTQNQSVLELTEDDEDYYQQYVKYDNEPAYDLVALQDESSEQMGYSSSAASGVESSCNSSDSSRVNNRQRRTIRRRNSKRIPTVVTLKKIATQELSKLTLKDKPKSEESAIKPLNESLKWLEDIVSQDQTQSILHRLQNAEFYKESIEWKKGPVLGKGAFAVCNQAMDCSSGHLMAIKSLKIEHNFMDSQNEADSNSSLSDLENQWLKILKEISIMVQGKNHPNLLGILGISIKNFVVQIFSEWMPGGTIASLLKLYGSFSESLTLSYGIQIARGLEQLHQFCIIHRDLKGANILVDATGRHLKISDFGTCAILAGQDSVEGQFRQEVMGTIPFMAPEVIKSNSYGRSCDIWSFGCCLIEMLTCKPPWVQNFAGNHYRIVLDIASSNKPPAFPKGISENMENLLFLCLKLDPSERLLAKQLCKHSAFECI